MKLGVTRAALFGVIAGATLLLSACGGGSGSSAVTPGGTIQSTKTGSSGDLIQSGRTAQGGSFGAVASETTAAAAFAGPIVAAPALIDGFVSTSYNNSTHLPCFGCAPNPPIGSSIGLDLPIMVYPHNTTSTIKETLLLQDNTITATCRFVFTIKQGAVTRATYSFNVALSKGFIWEIYHYAALPASVTAGAGTVSAQTVCPSFTGNAVSESVFFT